MSLFKVIGSAGVLVAAIVVRALVSPAADLPENERQIVGKVVAVSDGDTITVLDARQVQYKIRLEGIDSPESHQAFGSRAKQALAAKVFEKQVLVKWHELDKYQRVLGQVYVGDRWINRELVDDGFAWHFKKYSTSTDLASAEARARAAKAGLWTDGNPVAPWDFRHSAEAAAAALESPPPNRTANTVYLTKTGSKYHAANCRFLANGATPIELSEVAGRFEPCSVCRPLTTEKVTVPKATVEGAATLSPLPPADGD